MSEVLQGDVLTKQEMKQRKITVVDGTRGGAEFHAPTYSDIISTVLLRRGILDEKHVNAACDYLELKKAVYGFLEAKTMAGILRTGEAGAKREHAEQAYYVATRHLGRTSEKVVIIGMNEPADDTLDMAMVVNAYRSAFHQCFDAMELAVQKIRDEIQKNLV